jgi:hypothetical protein
MRQQLSVAISKTATEAFRAHAPVLAGVASRPLALRQTDDDVAIAPAPLLPGEQDTDYAEVALRIVKADIRGMRTLAVTQ